MTINVIDLTKPELKADYKRMNFNTDGTKSVGLQFDPFKEHDTYKPCDESCQWLCDDDNNNDEGEDYEPSYN